jgi:hypothetical protein
MVIGAAVDASVVLLVGRLGAELDATPSKGAGSSAMLAVGCATGLPEGTKR